MPVTVSDGAGGTDEGSAAAAGMVLVVGAVLTACSAQLGDRGGDEGAAPDRIGDVEWVEVFRNVDQLPNVARICVQGIAFAGTSSGVRGEDAVANPALVRVPEWDAVCAQHRRGGS